MCEPTTIAVLTLAATGAAAYGQYQSGQAQKDQARVNAKIADNQAIDAQQRGSIAERQQRDRVRQILGSQRAAIGASGVTASGSPLGILADTAQFGEQDALTVRNNAAREAFGFRVDAGNSRTRARIASIEGTTGAVSTLIGGGSQAFASYRSRGA